MLKSEMTSSGIEKIAVCIKQIPLVEDASFDPVRKTIKRDGPAVISAFDLRAIALASLLKAELGARVVVVTMGPPQARQALEEALAMGADEAVHLEDRAFAGSDTLATARALALYLKPQNFDLILLGKYSLDAETGQVGPEVAELLGIAHITNVRKLVVDGRKLKAERESDEGYDEVECETPALLTCAERVAQPIRVRPEALAKAKEKTIVTVRAKDLDPDLRKFGFDGSPTWVSEIIAVESQTIAGRSIEVDDPKRAARETVQVLEELGAFAAKTKAARSVSSRIRKPQLGRDVWVACETDLKGEITRASLELLGAADELASDLGGAVGSIICGRLSENQVRLLSSYGADRIFWLNEPALEPYSPDAKALAIANLVQDGKPWGLLVPASEHGRDWAPRLAARLGLGLTGDAIGLELDEQQRLVALKPAFGGNLVAKILSKTYPQMATVRPGVLEMPSPNSERLAQVVEIKSHQLIRPLSKTVASHRLLDESISALDGAEIVVGIGMGVGGPEGVEKIKEMARVMNAALCATRRVTDAGWVPRQLQVGLTGKAIAPRLYFAIGIRGAPNHTVGIKRAQIVVAINNDPQAPIFERASLRLVCDWQVIVPELTAELSRRFGHKTD